MAERLHDNAIRWQSGDTGGHVESFFLKANDPAEERAFWLKFTIFAPRGGQGAVAEVWAIQFHGGQGHRAGKQTFPVAELRPGPGRVGLTVGDCRFEPGHSAGRMKGADGQEFSWDVSFDRDRAPLRLYPFEWMYTAAFPKSKTLTPTSDTRYRGFVQAGDRRYEVQGWPGMQGHNWGRSHAERYAWAHCNVFEDHRGQPVDAVFEGFSGRIRVGPVLTPWLTGAALTHGGQTYAFNQPARLVRNHAEVEYSSWDFALAHGPNRLLGSFWTTPEQMVGLAYANPAGDLSHCLNSKIAHAELRLVVRGDTVAQLRSPGKAALEVTVKEPDHGVRMYA